MAFKYIVIFCVQAILIQLVASQCTSHAVVDTGLSSPLGWSAPVAYDARVGKDLIYEDIYPAIAPAIDFTPTTSGGLVVTSSSAIPPTGISVVSDNAFEGALSVAGEIPFVGTTAVEGLLAAVGTGAINHACGEGISAMISEPLNVVLSETPITIEPIALAPAAAAITPAAALSPAPITPRPGLGLGNRFGHRGCGNRGLVY